MSDSQKIPLRAADIPVRLLDRINHPADVASLNEAELAQLAEELCREIISVVSRNGGHLAPSLGVIELTLALLCELSPERDRIIWDVGHQCYAYKLLTGRRESFSTIRCLNGISGFPRRSESPYDHFGTGHASTSISAALGMAAARHLNKQDHHVAAIIGDGAMTAGLALEALNQAGHLGYPLIVILNDNDMSISRNVGALSLFLSSKLSSGWVRRAKREVEGWLRSIPGIGEDVLNLARRGEDSLISLFTPGMLFEAFGFDYIGPVDGHNIGELREMLRLAKSSDKPVLLHALTVKGKGYSPAEENPSRFHGIGCFNRENGQSAKDANTPNSPSFTEIFSKSLVELGGKDPRIVAITAAMPEGTGLKAFGLHFPDRLVDVGICEPHSVTFAAGLATQGMRPVVAVYSSFLQRSYDQLIHDVCLQNLPVVFCLDRAGLVGEDGPTHHGVFDLSYLRHIPNMCVLAPRHECELPLMLEAALAHNGPAAVRYPRGHSGLDLAEQSAAALAWGEGEILQRGKNIAVIGIGTAVNAGLAAGLLWEEEGNGPITVFNARFAKPLPEKQILAIAAEHECILLLEENVLAGGFSSAVLELLNANGLKNNVLCLGLPDAYIQQGPAKILRERIGLCAEGALAALKKLAEKS